MPSRISASLQQLAFLVHETTLQTRGYWWRWLGCWFTTAFWVTATYRIDRCLYLLFGRGWPLLRIALGPLRFLTHPWRGNCEIHYAAEIGPGLQVLHPALGVVVSKYLIAGQDLTLIGGNVIGGRSQLANGELVIGARVEVGVHAVILGPVHIGSDVKIGAGTVVVKDADSGTTLIGASARPVLPSALSPDSTGAALAPLLSPVPLRSETESARRRRSRSPKNL